LITSSFFTSATRMQTQMHPPNHTLSQSGFEVFALQQPLTIFIFAMRSVTMAMLSLLFFAVAVAMAVVVAVAV
jgi:hypothetical protein